MVTNTPYYQMRVDQPITNSDNAHAPAQTGVTQGGDQVLTSVNAVEHPNDNRRLSSYSKDTACQLGIDSQNAEENHSLVELLEAATTAAEQVSMTTKHDEIASVVPVPQGKSKRKTDPSLSSSTSTTNQESPQASDCPPAKRRRVDTSIDPDLHVIDKDTIMRTPTSHTSQLPSYDTIHSNARAAGVHSAAALFRRTPQLTTRKYTRPPMSKLFMSLNITPEKFIALQALAKAYMLSPAHPERQSCVGNRGKGDTDMVKLRLFNCVREFLADNGVGEQFFGEYAEKLGDRESSEAAAALGEEGKRGEKLLWPRDGNKIISLVTPLMRRMVTNERQRLYAIDTRKGGKKAEKEESVDSPATPRTPGDDVDQHAYTALDPTLLRSQRQTSSPCTQTPTDTYPCPTAPPTSNEATLSSPPPATLTSLPSASDEAEPHLTHINIFLTHTPNNTKQSIKLDEKRISTTRPAHLTFYNYTAFFEQVTTMVSQASLHHPTFTAPQSNSKSKIRADTEDLRGLAAAANALQPQTDKDEQLRPSTPTRGASPQYTVKTIGPMGWQVIDSAETWYHVLTERAFATWADGVCNVIVELRSEMEQRVVRKGAGVTEGGKGDVQMEEV